MSYSSPSRKSVRSRQLRFFRPQYEELENRIAPATSLTYSVPADGPHDLTLQFNSATGDIEILDNGILVENQALSDTIDIVINGVDAQNETLTVEIPGTVSLPPIAFNGGQFDDDQIIVSADLDFFLDDFNLFVSDGTTVALDGVEEASLTGGGGDNMIDASSFSGNTTLDGGAGNDSLIGGAGCDSMLGGAGNDTLESTTGGDDQMQGGMDNDFYLVDPGSELVVTDDGGNDVIDLSMISDSGVEVTLGASSGDVSEFVNPASVVTIIGAFETLIGTSHDDIITATNTTLLTLTQTFVGGSGNDMLIDMSTAETLNFHGNSGDDTFVLNPGSTVVVTDDGGMDTFDFSMFTGGGATVMLGDFNATANVLGGNVVATGTFENVKGTDFDDMIFGNSADNSFFGGLGNDLLDGGEGLDFLDGGGGDDTLIGGDGNDTLGGGDGLDSLDGGADDDMVLGGADDDMIAGADGTDTLDGGTGDDMILGGDGNDMLTGGGGNDAFDGGLGDDEFMIVLNSSFVFFDSGGVDTLNFSGSTNGIHLNLSSKGNQTVDAAGNKVKLIGVFENVIGTEFDDHINGNSADNVIVGGGGNDFLAGQSGRDILIGGAGADRLDGGPDDDILIGGTTAFDNNVAALLAIKAEWSSSRDYITRVNNIRGTANVGPRFNNGFFLQIGLTVFDDVDADKMTGSQGMDWFFVFSIDMMTGAKKNEEFN